jgi:hypothetical protein
MKRGEKMSVSRLFMCLLVTLCLAVNANAETVKTKYIEVTDIPGDWRVEKELDDHIQLVTKDVTYGENRAVEVQVLSRTLDGMRSEAKKIYEEIKGEEWTESNLGKHIQFIRSDIRLVVVLEYLGSDVIAVKAYRNKSYIQKCKITVFAEKARKDWDMATARAEAQEQAQRNTSACSHVYAGKTFEYKGGILGMRIQTMVIGFSPETQRVTIRNPHNGYTQEISCYDVPR